MTGSGDECEAVSAAIVLAAGNGDRFDDGRHQSKLLHPVLGEPLIHRTLRSAFAAGITKATIVLGYQAEQVRQAALACTIPGLTLDFAYNPHWHLENGASVLAARPNHANGRFALLMGDHVFEPSSLTRLRRTRISGEELLLAVDGGPALPDVAVEATKVRLRRGRIAQIGKEVAPYDALDTGMFICGRSIFKALAVAAAIGDTTLSAGVRVLAARGLARALDISGAYWRDVDTIADMAAAEADLSSGASLER